MKKIININLASRLIPIEDSAYEILRQYLDSLKRYFAREEGGDEIVSDIEGRIAEIFQDKLKKGAHCITDEDVLAVKTAMGTPEQFDDAPESSSQQQEQQATNEAIYNTVRPRKRLYRDPDSKVLGGVCGGLGAYLNVDPVVFRIIFALLAIGGFGSGILVYFILWIVTPEANTAAEKLQMRGERVDINNIRATVQDEINAAKGHLKNLGDDMRNFSQGRGKQIGSDLERGFRNLFEGLGKVLMLLIKVCFYAIAVGILLVLIGIGVAITTSSVALYPLKDLFLAGTIQNLLFWPALFILFGIPIVALIIFLMRKATGGRETNKFVGYSLSLIWFIGLVCGLIVLVSVVKDFRRGSYPPIKEKLSIMQPSNGKLVIKQADEYADADEIDFFDNIIRVTEDTAIIKSVRVYVEKSDTDSFEVYVEKYSRGRRTAIARQLANEIQYQIVQKDSVIYVPSGISIPRDSKFRGQQVKLIIKVPKGKNIVMDKWLNYDYNTYDEDRWDDWEYRRHRETEEIKMGEDGRPENIGQPSSGTENQDSLKNNYRYKGRTPENKTPVEDSGRKEKPASGEAQAMAWEGVDLICYSMYNLIK